MSVRIDEPLVAALVAEQFPEWAHLPIRPVTDGGWDNRTFHLGEHMSVRLPSRAAYCEQVPKEQRWLPILAPQLPLPIPQPLAMGKPNADYPWHWSIYRWLDGECASRERISDLSTFTAAVADFLAALQRIDTTDAPPPGQHNFWRGGSLDAYDSETQAAIETLGDAVDGAAATALWDAARASEWNDHPVWVHGDVAAGNLLVDGGELCAVIDFGCCAVGDPACDMAVAWTLLDRESRATFRDRLDVDPGTWLRGRGWVLWKALITLSKDSTGKSDSVHGAKRALDEVLSEHRHEARP